MKIKLDDRNREINMETKVLRNRKIINLVVVLNLIIINAEVDKGIFLSFSTVYISPKKSGIRNFKNLHKFALSQIKNNKK